MVREPSLFVALKDAEGEAWVHLHAHDARGALERFSASNHPTSAVGAARARLEEFALQADLQRLTQAAVQRLDGAWRARGATPSGWTLVVARLATCEGAPPPALSAEELGNLEAISRDRAPTDVGAIVAGASQPMWVTQDNGIERRWSDPCVHAGLRELVHPTAPGPELATSWAAAGLEGFLFAPWLHADDVRAQASVDPALWGASSAALEAALGLPARAPDADDAELARVEIREADRRLREVRVALLANADADGAALVEQIGVIDRLRHEVLVVRARRDLLAGHPRRALATLTLARDVTERGVGPRNAPALFALLAEANLRTGHTREALDSLQILATTRPEVVATREIVGDLAVLEGLDRQGDSKEH
jgi:hypothetical protein